MCEKETADAANRVPRNSVFVRPEHRGFALRVGKCSRFTVRFLCRNFTALAWNTEIHPLLQSLGRSRKIGAVVVYLFVGVEQQPQKDNFKIQGDDGGGMPVEFRGLQVFGFVGKAHPLLLHQVGKGFHKPDILLKLFGAFPPGKTVPGIGKEDIGEKNQAIPCLGQPLRLNDFNFAT